MTYNSQKVSNSPLGSFLVASDTINSVDYQIVKLDIGAEGVSSPVTSLNPIPVTITAQTSSTATRTQVNDTASDTLILAANTSRKGASIYNDSSAALYLGLGTATVTTTDYSVRVRHEVLYEVPFGFVGQIRGLWATDPNDGGARITEFT